jgi:hypothetical protein
VKKRGTLGVGNGIYRSVPAHLQLGAELKNLGGKNAALKNLSDSQFC